jgi:putative ABC transport system permease protein
MLSLYLTLSLRYFTRRWIHAALIVASIMLGVATLIATQALGKTMSKATLAAGNPMAGTIDLIITNGDLNVDRDLTRELEGVPGIKAMYPRIFDKAKILIGDKRIPVMVLGIDLSGDMKEFDDLKDQFTFHPDSILVDYLEVVRNKKIPAILGKELEDELNRHATTFEFPTLKTEFVFMKFEFKLLQLERGVKEHSLARVGSLGLNANTDKDKFAAFAGQVVILDLANAAQVLDIDKGKVKRIDIALTPGIDPKQAREQVKTILNGRALVRTMEEQNQSLQSAMIGMETGFALCGLAALIVGMFLVYNALSVSVAERRHEIGILLAVGATRDQVWRLFAGEAFFLGVIGGALGVPFGYALAYLGLQPMRAAISEFVATVNEQPIELGWNLIALAFTVGIVSAVVASLIPTIRAAYEKPAEAVRKIPKESSASHVALHVALVGLLILSGMSMILLREMLPVRWGTYGGLSLVMVGALVSAPLFAQLAARALMPIARSLFPIEWRIAADNLIRAPGRTGMVIAALAAGVCLIVETAGIIRSNRVTIRQWIDESIAADIVVTSGSPVGAGGQNLPMAESVGDEMRKLSEVEDVSPMRLTTEVLFREKRVAILAFAPEKAMEHEKNRLQKHDQIDLYEAMIKKPNTIVVSNNFAALYHVRKGDILTLQSPNGEVKFHIVGTMVDYSWNLGTIMMNRRDYIEHWKDSSVTIFDVFLRENVDARDAKVKIVARFGAQFDLHALTRDELKSHIDRTIEKLYFIAVGQEIVVIIVAALGVVMALLISVLQRKREMGLLRAIGASQAQVIYLVLAEAGLMGAFGSIIGVLFSIPLQWYALQVIFLEESGYVFPVLMPWGESLIIALSATLIAILAGIGPAKLAVRERIPDAIAYE